MSSIISDASRSARKGTDKGLQEVLDFLVTQEQLSVTVLAAAIDAGARRVTVQIEPEE